jgi:hypothetical protein
MFDETNPIFSTASDSELVLPHARWLDGHTPKSSFLRIPDSQFLPTADTETAPSVPWFCGDPRHQVRTEYGRPGDRDGRNVRDRLYVSDGLSEDLVFFVVTDPFSYITLAALEVLVIAAG